MRILFAAPVSFNNITFFISHYIVGLLKASKKLGHNAKIVQTTENTDNLLISNTTKKEFAYLRKYAKLITDLPHDLILMNQLNYEVKLFKPDIIFLHLIDSYYTHLIIDKLKKTGACVVTWLGIHPKEVSKGIRKILRKSTYTLIYDSEYINYYKYNNINNTRIIPLGCDIDSHESIIPDKTFLKNNSVEVSFIGIIDSHREKYLKSLKGFELGIWSWNISEFVTDLKKYYKGVAYGETLVKVIKSSKISINIHRNFEISGGNYRLFEIPACGVMQMVDEKNNISKYFEPDKEIVTFRNPDELKDKVKYYLTHTQERKKIARAGFERVKRDHTLIDRMKTIISICEGK